MKLVFLLEEKSMKYFLDGILPRILPENIEFITIPHEGKSALRKSLQAKLKGWTEPDVKFVIVQDQDSNDCRRLKQELLELCAETDRQVIVRIACHELEAWYFGDLDAVSRAYGKDLTHLKAKRKYRIPDDILNPKRKLQHYLPEHQQIEGARRIAPQIDIHKNTSTSFQVFVSGVKKLIGA